MFRMRHCAILATVALLMLATGLLEEYVAPPMEQHARLSQPDSDASAPSASKVSLLMWLTATSPPQKENSS